jgi:hypothetical protein
VQNTTKSSFHELSIDTLVDGAWTVASHSKLQLNFNIDRKICAHHVAFSCYKGDNFCICENNCDNILHLTPYMSKSNYKLEEGHQGESRSRPCHSMRSMLLQNWVLSLLLSRDNRVLCYTMLHDMLLKTIALLSLIIILVNSLFSASTALYFRRLTASLAGAQHYICSVKR